jgi:hypothetical protein
MSYINEALRKAQRERDNRYGQFGGIIADSPGGAGRLRKRRIVLFAAAALILLVSASSREEGAPIPCCGNRRPAGRSAAA